MLGTEADQDNTGSKIVFTYDFGAVSDSNETKAYEEACAAAGGTVLVFEGDVAASCRAESADHIPYEVHLDHFFKCTGPACDEDEVPLEAAVDFAVKVIEGRQEGVYCALGTDEVELPEDGASAFSFMAGIIMTGAAVFALF